MGRTKKQEEEQKGESTTFTKVTRNLSRIVSVHSQTIVMIKNGEDFYPLKDSVNQSPLPFFMDAKKTYGFVEPGKGHEHNTWISQPGKCFTTFIIYYAQYYFIYIHFSR